jgi:hypothetical protein
VKASDGFHESLELTTLVDVLKALGETDEPDATRIGPEDDDFDVVSHATEDRGGVENQRAALSLPADPDKPQAKRRQVAVRLLRGWE